MDTRPVVLITGAARGIGKAIAAGFTADGARVGMADILEAELLASAAELADRGAEVHAAVADVTDPAAVSGMVASVEAALGPVSVLVSNAGTFSQIGPVWEADPERWFHDIRVNLYGSFLCCREVAGRMVARGAGRIINITTTGGVNDPHPYSTSYACSKTALVRLTEALAQEAEPHGVKVFAVGPPAIDTEMTRFIAEDPSGRKWRPGFDRYLREGGAHPPELIADLCVRLASGAADRLSGRYIRATRDIDHLIATADEIIADDRLVLRIPGF